VAGKSPAEAVQNFRDPLQLAISCVTQGYINVRGGYHPGPKPHPLTLNEGAPVQLSGSARLLLSVIQLYSIVESKVENPLGDWKVSTAAYQYSLAQENGKEILAYHWHPDARNSIRTPHLHIGPGAQAKWKPLAKAHIPTGRIALEDLLRLAIRDFGVEPLRPDWAEVLDLTQGNYEAWRTWSGSKQTQT
jgi:hypothetical protein